MHPVITILLYGFAFLYCLGICVLIYKKLSTKKQANNEWTKVQPVGVDMISIRYGALADIKLHPDIVIRPIPAIYLQYFKRITQSDLIQYVLSTSLAKEVDPTFYRVLTLVADFNQYVIPKRLFLVDNDTLGYYRYYKALLKLQAITPEQRRDEPIGRQSDSEEIITLLLAKMSEFVGLLNPYYATGNFIPFDMFYNNLRSIYEVLLIVLEKYHIRCILTAYCLVTNTELPLDYIELNALTDRLVDRIRGLLPVQELVTPEPEVVDVPIPHLTIIK